MSTLWADDLKCEYETGRKRITQHLKTLDKDNINEALEASYCNSAIRSSKEVEEWLITGRDPNSYGGIDKKSIYQRNSWDAMDLIPDIRDELESDGPPELSLSVDSKEKLARIFSALSPRERQCYILHNAQRLSMAQIGEELGISKGTVQDYLKRAKRKVELRS